MLLLFIFFVNYCIYELLEDNSEISNLYNPKGITAT